MEESNSEISWRDGVEAVGVVDGETKDAVLPDIVDNSEADSDKEATLVATATDESLTLVDAELATGSIVDDAETMVDWTKDIFGLETAGWSVEDTEPAINWKDDIVELDVAGSAVDVTKPEASWRVDAEAVWVVDGETKDAVLPVVMDTSEAGGDEEATLVATDESSTLVDAVLATGMAVGDMEADVDWIDNAA